MKSAYYIPPRYRDNEMGYKIRLSTVLIVCVSTSFLVTCMVAVLPLTSDGCICTLEEKTGEAQSYKKTDEGYKKYGHNLALIVPFRDRFNELLEFAPHMNKYLLAQGVNHHIFVINQVDSYRFNRASLINVGFLETRDEYDYMAMHDVDLLPLNPNLSYGYPENNPFHVASPELHPRYHYQLFIGGILLLKREHFELVNGMSNKYWGWGLEDDEFQVRLKEAKLNVSRPINIKTDSTNTFNHIHDSTVRKRDMVKCYNQREETRKRDRVTGLHDVQYQVTKRHQLIIDHVPVTVINIQLHCDKNVTPWCECLQSEDKGKSNKANVKKSVKGKS